MDKRNLSKYLRGEALKATTYILNIAPNKYAQKYPFELWIVGKPNLYHLFVWGCHTEVRLFNHVENKTDPKTVRAYFIGYPESSKGYKFIVP